MLKYSSWTSPTGTKAYSNLFESMFFYKKIIPEYKTIHLRNIEVGQQMCLAIGDRSASSGWLRQAPLLRGFEV